MLNQESEQPDVDLKSLLRKSEIAYNESLVREANASAAEKLTAVRSINMQIVRDENKDRFDEAQDYRHGYINFTAPVSEDTAMQFNHLLRRINRMYPQRDIIIELNTPGGDIVAGFQMFDEIVRMRAKGHKITIRVRGQAASMGAVILQSADVREVGPSAFVMIHRASFGAAGDAYKVEDTVEFVKMLESRIVDILDGRSNKGRAFFTKMLSERRDQWFTAEQAVEAGLADAVE